MGLQKSINKSYSNRRFEFEPKASIPLRFKKVFRAVIGGLPFVPSFATRACGLGWFQTIPRVYRQVLPAFVIFSCEIL